MAEASVQKALIREFERELGVPSAVAKKVASDVTGKVRLKLDNPPCPKCGGSFPKRVGVGERAQCSYCRNYFSVEDSTEKAVADVLKDYEKLSEQFVQRVQVLFSSNVEAIMGKLEKIETTVLETQRMVQEILAGLNVPVQLPTAIGGEERVSFIGDASARAEATEAVRQFGRVLEGVGEDVLRGLHLDLETLVRAGNVHFDNKEYGKALLYYERAVTVDSYNEKVWFNMGYAYYKLGDFVKAIERYRRSTKIKPDLLEAWNNMGAAYDGLGDIGKAIEMYEKTTKIRPDFVLAWSNMGAAYYKLGDFVKVMKMYERVVKLKPDHAEAWNNMGIAYYKLGDFRKAIAMYDRAIKIKPNLAEAWNNMGIAYESIGDRANARRCYLQAEKYR